MKTKSDRIKQTKCKHLNARITGHELVGTMTCSDCREVIPLFEMLNNLLDALREEHKKCKK